MPSRSRTLSNGQWVDSGSYVIDLQTKTIGRFVRSTGIYPRDRDALTRVHAMKHMIRQLDRFRDHERLMLIKAGTISLIDALHAYQEGSFSFTDIVASKPLRATFEQWVTDSPLSTHSKRNRLTILNCFVSRGFLSDKSPVYDVPDVLRRARIYYASMRRAHMYNQARSHLLMFLRDGLGLTIESAIWRRAHAVPLLKPNARRPHYPLADPRELQQLCRVINSDRGNNDHPHVPTDYRPMLLFMALSGLRPTEFFRGLWSVDERSGHIRVHGTKTANAVRVIPCVYWLHPQPRSECGLLQRLDAVLGTHSLRARDLRRTYAIWCENAQIPRSRIAYYMGHAPRDMTSLYQMRVPSTDDLTRDAALLTTWVQQFVPIDAIIA